MRSVRSALLCAFTLLAVSAVPPLVPPAEAGCGCDHPPPAFALVMPPFGSPGRTIRLHAKDRSFVPGVRYTVTFQPYPSGLAAAATVVAFRPDQLQVAVPSGLAVGPVKLAVKAPGFQQSYGPELFTALPLPRRLPTGDASISLKGLYAAVTTDGTLLLPLDLSDISDPTQLAFLLANVPLAFGPDDVVFYNRDGVDLTLFTLQVNDPTSRQWGSYHGWEVEDDATFHNVVYENKVVKSKIDKESDLLTYWRHEFYTYKRAHGSGGSHAVNGDGFHPDGTLHVDHGMLVLAIHGGLRDKSAPQDPTRQTALAPGRLKIDLLATSAVTNDPIEPDVMAERARSSPAYREMTGSLNDTLAGVTGQTDSVEMSSGPLGLGTTTSILLNPLNRK